MTEVRCPSCRTALRPAPGPARLNLCPACGGTVQIPASAATNGRPTPRPSAPPPQPRYDEDDRPARRYRDDDEDDDYDRRPARRGKPAKSGGNVLIFAAVGGVGFLALVGIGVVVAVSASGGKPTAEFKPVGSAVAPPPPASLPAKPAKKSAPVPADPTPVAIPPAPPIPAGEVIPKVKESTVYIRTHFGNDMIGMGSGFFAGKPGYVVTNAHVVGYTREGGYRKPLKIEVVINSGEANEKTYPATLFGFDATLGVDLAMLKVNADDLPPPLAIGSAASLRETEEVMIFGYPLGETLGLNVSVNKTTVSSLRKENGKIVVVQVAGGMQKGNSGGPVVNHAGQVIGVSVAIITGTVLNFAIPAELVTTFVEDQYASGGKENLSDLKPAGTLTLRMPGRSFGPGRSLLPPGAPSGPPVSLPGLPEMTLPPNEPRVTVKPMATADKLPPSTPDGRPRVIGGGTDPEFRDDAPAGTVLAGLDIGVGTFGGSIVVRSFRPIYRAGSADTPGAVQGDTKKTPTFKVRARPGYAVGAVTVKAGLGVDGLGVTFMKVLPGGKLDPTDTYDGPWLGGLLDGTQVRLDAAGAPVVGVAGRTGSRGLTGFGLVVK